MTEKNSLPSRVSIAQTENFYFYALGKMMFTRITFIAFSVTTLSACMTLMFDFSRFDGSNKLHEHLEIREVNSSFKEPTRLSVFAAAMERVDLKKNPGTETCEGFANWLPNEMIRVSTKMDLRLVGFGQFGKGFVVTHPSGKIECGAFAVNNNPAEIVIKNAAPGVYQVRISSPVVNPRVSDYDNNKREPENENRLYRGDYMQIFAEDVSDRNLAKFQVAELKSLHLRIREKGRLEANSSWDQSVEQGRTILAQESKQRSEFFSDVLSTSVQALEVVAKEQQAQALAAEATEQQLGYAQMQQQELRSISTGGKKLAPTSSTQALGAGRNSSTGNQIARTDPPQQGQLPPKQTQKNDSSPAIVLEFPNPDGWKRGESSNVDNAGNLAVSFETRPVATKGKMSVVTSFCNTGDTVWKGGIRVSTTPPTRSHASREITAGECSRWEETFSEGPAIIYIYSKRASQ